MHEGSYNCISWMGSVPKCQTKYSLVWSLSALLFPFYISLPAPPTTAKPPSLAWWPCLWLSPPRWWCCPRLWPGWTPALVTSRRSDEVITLLSLVASVLMLLTQSADQDWLNVDWRVSSLDQVYSHRYTQHPVAGMCTGSKYTFYTENVVHSAHSWLDVWWAHALNSYILSYK